MQPDTIENAIAAETAEAKGLKPYTVRSFAEIVEMQLPPLKYAWGGVELSNSSTAEIIGPPGLGKSRFAFNVAFHQILQRPFPNAEYSALGQPLKWLFLGTENSIRRWQSDARKMASTLTDEELELMRTHLFLPTLEGESDAYMILDDADNVERCKATVRKINPDVIVWDPFGDLCSDELKDDIQREAVRTIRMIARSGANPNVPNFILNHSRLGNAVYMSALSDGGNYGRNSKAIFGQMRNVFNLRPAFQEPERFGDGIEIIDQKHNDRRGFALCAVRLNTETMIYEPITDFDHAAAQAEWERLSGKRSGGSAASGGSGRGHQLTQSEIADYLPTLAEYVKSLEEPPATKTLRVKIMDETQASKSSAEYVIEKLTEKKRGEQPPFGIISTDISFPKSTRYGTPEQIAAFTDRLARERAERKSKGAARG